MIEDLTRQHNPVADAFSKNSHFVQVVQAIRIMEIEGVESTNMKETYLNSHKFGTQYNLALEGRPTLQHSKYFAHL